MKRLQNSARFGLDRYFLLLLFLSLSVFVLLCRLIDDGWKSATYSIDTLLSLSGISFITFCFQSIFRLWKNIHSARWSMSMIGDVTLSINASLRIAGKYWKSPYPISQTNKKYWKSENIFGLRCPLAPFDTRNGVSTYSQQSESDGENTEKWEVLLVRKKNGSATACNIIFKLPKIDLQFVVWLEIYLERWRAYNRHRHI